ncbi:pentatricopeptide repeat-containing protein [Panicum miliaceum]|uniref:Pentatricopeptide repeat-containing protein n=1 Tax=Panicum miliaceum TaxID=4540 RepID=A0A3L6PS92_PANMI|nr:pentatricopeptide repeat-containing protein [Panicum miliaceum]
MAPPPRHLPLLLGRLLVAGEIRRSPDHLRRIIPLLPSQPHLAAALSSLYFPLFPSSTTFLHNLLIRASTASPSPRLSFAAFSSLLRCDFLPDHFTFPPLVKSASRLPSFPRTGAQVHAQAARRGFLTDIFVLTRSSRSLEEGRWAHTFIDKHKMVLDNEFNLGAALIDMYGKCGRTDMAVKVFHSLDQKNVSAWNALITGLAVNGDAPQCIDVFEQMKRSGENPNDITFVSLLTACAHAELVYEGRQCFQSMVSAFGMQPELKHYGCVVDLLGRAGLLDEAEELIRSMPMAPDVKVLGALLGASRMHKRFDVAERVQSWILSLNTKQPGFHVLISDIYAAAGKWTDALEARGFLQRHNIRKLPASSSSRQ